MHGVRNGKNPFGLRRNMERCQTETAEMFRMQNLQIFQCASWLSAQGEWKREMGLHREPLYKMRNPKLLP